MEFRQLRKNLKKDFSTFKKIKLAIVSDWSIQMLAQAIRGLGYEKELDIEIYEATYDQMEPELLDPTSKLYSFNPDYVLIFPCAEKYYSKFIGMSSDDKLQAADAEAARIFNLCSSVSKNSSANVILCNYCEIKDGIYGNYAASYPESYLYSQRQLNDKISQIVVNDKNIYLADILSLQNEYGRKTIFDERLYYISKTVFAMEFLPVVSEQIVSIITVLLGKIKKCIVCDLDNTLWGGVIGDDGIEGIQIGNNGKGLIFSDIQKWVKALSERGIAVAICSKNNEDTAKEPFEVLKEMDLKLENISVFVANWEDKVSNIRSIQQILNLGIDSFVFIDDNPFERSLVREKIPEIMVPELPDDASQYLEYLRGLTLFETAGLSESDKKRTSQYREEADRNKLKVVASSIDDYLSSLNMVAEVKPFDSFSLPRVAQLSQRSNQFNLRTVRYTEQAVQGIINSGDRYITMTVDMKDQFGEYGIIGLVILEKINEDTMFVDTLIMSCRVLKRTVEEYVFNKIVDSARKANIKKIVGEYIPTKKNAMVKGVYGDYGFSLVKSEDGIDTWELDVNGYIEKKTFVQDREEE